MHESKNKLNEEYSKEFVNSNNKPGRKSVFSEPSEETIFSLSRTSNAFADQIVHLLKNKCFKHLLEGNIKNDPKMHRFSMSMHLSGHHLALDVPTFACNDRALLINLTRKFV